MLALVTMWEYAGYTSELKFVVSEDVAQAAREWACRELDADPHGVDSEGGGYRTASLYFDTETFDLYNRRGSTGRAKFRVRRYNGGAIVFLERKQKVDGRLYKRRSLIPLEDLGRVASETEGGEPEERWPGRWFVRRLRNRRLRPVCQIVYSRTARVGAAREGALRLTIDRSIFAQPVHSFDFRDEPGVQLLPDMAILELKYETVRPALFERLVADLGLEPRALSKYRLAAGTLGLAAPPSPPSSVLSLVG